MSANAEIVRRFAADLLGRADLGTADAIVAKDVVVHTGLSPAEPIRGHDTSQQVLAGFADTFPVSRMDIHETLEAGPDRVVLRFTAHATHAKEYYGVAATGRPCRCMAPVIAPMVLT